MRAMERVAVCVRMSEAVLLVGETGTGKTALVQQLAHLAGCTLTVLVSEWVVTWKCEGVSGLVELHADLVACLCASTSSCLSWVNNGIAIFSLSSQ